MTILLHVIVQTLCSLNTTSCATTGSSNKCTASRHFPQMGKRYEAQGSWVNWAKLASEVEGEDLAAEGSMNRLAQICQVGGNLVEYSPFIHFWSFLTSH